jgi:hypothetical protein
LGYAADSHALIEEFCDSVVAAQDAPIENPNGGGKGALGLERRRSSPRARPNGRFSLPVGEGEQAHQIANGRTVRRDVGIAPCVWGFGRLSRLSFETLGKPQFSSMNFKSETWSA